MNKYYKTAIASILALGLSGCSILSSKGKDLEDRVSHVKTAPVTASPAEIYQDDVYKAKEKRLPSSEMSDSGKMLITLALGASYKSGGSFAQEDGRWVYKDENRMVTYEEFIPEDGSKPRFRIRYTPLSEKERNKVEKASGDIGKYLFKRK